jgi:hypothetical protein
MPPRSAPNAVIIRLPNTASARPSRTGREQRGISSGRVLAVAVQQDDDVEAAFDRERVADLLVAAVALVELVAQHRHPDLGMRLLVLAPEANVRSSEASSTTRISQS